MKRRRRGKAIRSSKSAAKPSGVLQYKIVELSTVDEASIEDAVNMRVQEGWNFEGLQFAMRESSKRPAMAFVFFTRDSERWEHDDAEAAARLRRLATGSAEPRLRTVSALERLEQLASEEPDE